jgi:membrane-associated protease RseP (regulator of RpoE activity)
MTIISLGVFASPCLSQGVFSGLIISEKKDSIKIVEVQSGSPGFDAGLRKGDIVLEIDGKKIRKLRDYVKISRKLKGKNVEVALVILRKGVSYDVTIMIYSVPIYQHWKEKVAKPTELPRGLTNTPYVYWVGKGFRALQKPNDKLSFDAKVANYNLALKFLLNALHYRPESIDAALKVAKAYNELGKLYVMKGDIKEGIINYRRAIKFYAGSHGKTEDEDHLSVILTNLQEIEKSLSNVESGNLKVSTEPQRKSLKIQQ